MTPTTLLPLEETATFATHRADSVAADRSVTLVGIVLAGSYHRPDTAFSGLPRPLVPIAQAPLVSYALRWLAASGVTSARLCINGHSRPVDTWLTTAGARLNIPIDFVEDSSPRGPAGSARDAALATGADTFVVVEGTVIPVVDVDAVLAEHQRKRAALTTVVHEQAMPRTGGARLSTPAGIYVFSRRAFEAVSKQGYQDIKDHLIPALRRRGERIAAFVAPHYSPRVINAETYLAVNHWVIEQLFDNPDLMTAGDVYVRNGELVAHPTADIHPSAQIIGPVVVGPGSSIGAHATIVGPTSIGANTVVGDGAVVCRSVVWADCEIGTGAFVDHAVVADGVGIPDRCTVHREVKMRTEPRWRIGVSRAATPHRIQPAPAGSIADLVAP
jgi:NDP-sugar pyrophosphorylase family protein